MISLHKTRGLPKAVRVLFGCLLAFGLATSFAACRDATAPATHRWELHLQADRPMSLFAGFTLYSSNEPRLHGDMAADLTEPGHLSLNTTLNTIPKIGVVVHGMAVPASGGTLTVELWEDGRRIAAVTATGAGAVVGPLRAGVIDDQ